MQVAAFKNRMTEL